MREAGQNVAAPASADNPWKEVPKLSQLGSTPAPVQSQRAVAYSDWAMRMKEKRVAEAAATATPVVDEEPVSAMWSTDALYQQVEEDEAPRVEVQTGEHARSNPWRVKNLLAVLDLREGASPDEIGNAYRRLAKLHHPDRFVDADEATQTFHAARMRGIIDAYRELRQLEKV